MKRATEGRRQKEREAARLRDAERLNGIQIAERMGISVSYAYELLTDPGGAKHSKRKRARHHGGSTRDEMLGEVLDWIMDGAPLTTSAERAVH